MTTHERGCARVAQSTRAIGRACRAEAHARRRGRSGASREGAQVRRTKRPAMPRIFAYQQQIEGAPDDASGPPDTLPTVAAGPHLRIRSRRTAVQSGPESVGGLRWVRLDWWGWLLIEIGMRLGLLGRWRRGFGNERGESGAVQYLGWAGRGAGAFSRRCAADVCVRADCL